MICRGNSDWSRPYDLVPSLLLGPTSFWPGGDFDRRRSKGLALVLGGDEGTEGGEAGSPEASLSPTRAL